MQTVRVGQRVLETQRVTLSASELERAWGWTRGQMRGCLKRGDLTDVGIGRRVRIDVDEAVARTLELVDDGELAPDRVDALCDLLVRAPVAERDD